MSTSLGEMKTPKLLVIYVCCGICFAFLDNHGSTRYPSRQQVDNGDLSKTLLDKIIQQEIALGKLQVKQASQEEKIKALTQELSLVQDENRAMKDQVNTMKNVLANSTCSCELEKHEMNIMTTIDDLKKEYRYLTLSLLDLQANTRDDINKTELGLRQLLLRTQHEQAYMSSALANVKKEFQDLKNDSLLKISFTAGLSSSVSSIKSGTTLIFGKVISNMGGGYNPNTGVFTSPKEGIFVFFCSVYTDSNADERRTDIVLNGNNQVQLYDYDHEGYVIQSSGMVVLHLHVGDKVWIRHNRGSHGYYTERPPWTTFSGFMI